MDKVHFIKAFRDTEHSVKVAYSLNANKFAVTWYCINPYNKDDLQYQLCDNVICTDDLLRERLDAAIFADERDDNNDIDIYYALRDTFDANDCLNHEIQSFEHWRVKFEELLKNAKGIGQEINNELLAELQWDTFDGQDIECWYYFDDSCDHVLAHIDKLI